MKNFINLSDIDKKDLRKIIDEARIQKLKKKLYQQQSIFDWKNFNYDF